MLQDYAPEAKSSRGIFQFLALPSSVGISAFYRERPEVTNSSCPLWPLCTLFIKVLACPHRYGDFDSAHSLFTLSIHSPIHHWMPLFTFAKLSMKMLTKTGLQKVS